MATSRPPSSGNPSAGSIGKVQTVLESHTASLTSLINGQKSTHKTVQKTQTSLEQLSANHAAFLERLEKLQTSTDQNAALSKQQTERLARLQTSTDQNAILSKQHTEKQTTKIEQKVNLALDNKVSKLEASNDKRMNDLTKLCQNILDRVEESGKKTGCDHDVIPPPRKMNRRLIGYVYSRLGE